MCCVNFVKMNTLERPVVIKYFVLESLFANKNSPKVGEG